MKKRSEIDNKYLWDLSGYCNCIDEALLCVDQLKKEVEYLAKFEFKLKDDDMLYECLEANRKFGEKFEALAVYLELKLKEDATNKSAEEAVNYIGALSSDIDVNLAFINSEISNFSKARLKELILNQRFFDYKEMFKEVLRTKKHDLPKAQEKLLARVGDYSSGFGDVFDMFDSCDVKFEKAKDSKGKEYEVNSANYSLLLRSKDSVLRENAFNSMQNAYGKFTKTLGTNYINSIKVDYAYSKIRGFNSSLQSALFYTEISDDVYNALIKQVNSELPYFSKYYDLKKKMLSLGEFKNSDAFAENPNIPQLDFSFESAFELIKKALSPLGNEYLAIVDKAKNEHWVDVMPSIGKDTGAFSSGAYGKNPVILMNFVGDINSVFTLIHEMGHSVHTYLADNNQNSINSDYPIFLAEIASTTNEMLLLRYLSSTAKNKQEKIYYLDLFLGMVRSTIMRQTMFAEFEEIAHERYEKHEMISSEILCEVYLQLNKKYYGENVKILQSTEYEWLRIPHFYNSFYVYQYATGLVSAVALSEKILNDSSFYKKYLKMLASGGSKSPKETLEICGIDLSQKDVYQNCFDTIVKSIKELNELL